MRTLLYILLLSISYCGLSQVQVKGYYKSNGTYVAPHVRSSPNSTKTDNYSYPGNNTPTYTPNVNGNYISPKSSDVWVDGYYRSDGTFVKGYWRTAPNNTEKDNFSYPGNINPYTGKLAPGAKLTVKTQSLDIYDNTSLNSNLITKLNYGEMFEVVENSDYEWTKVKFFNYNQNGNWVTNYGFIYFENHESESNNSGLSSIKYIYLSQKIVKADILNVRKGPSTDYEILAKITKGKIVNVIDYFNSEWVKISYMEFDFLNSDFKTIEGYVSATYLLDY